MTPFRLLLLLALVASGAWFSLSAPADSEQDVPLVVRREVTYDEEGNMVLGPPINRHLRDAPSAARKLGIAQSNFIPSDWEGREESEIVELSYRDRKLKEKFETTGLKRIGNSAIFTQPDAAAPNSVRRRGR